MVLEQNQNVMTKESKFNMALATLERIHLILLEINVCRNNPQLWKQWRILLDGLYCEVFPKLNEEERKKADKHRQTISKSIIELLKLLSSPNLTVKKHVDYFPILNSLFFFELFLRDNLQKHNLYLPDKKSIDSALDEL